MIRVALQYYEVKDKTESIRYTYKGEISPLPYTYKQLEEYETKVVPVEEAVDGSSGNGNSVSTWYSIDYVWRKNYFRT